MVVTAPDEKELSADCARADQAARHWARVLPVMQGGMFGDSDTTNLSRDTAGAAAAVRREAAAIEDAALQTKVNALATALEKVSRGNPKSPPNGWPDKEYVGGYQGTTAALHDLKIACPDIGDDPLPAVDMPSR